MSHNKMGLAGVMAAGFQNSALTPLLAIIALLLGFFAIAVTPKEEEPQIDVTFANVFIAYPGASAKEVEQLVSIPAQQVLSELPGVDDIFSISSPGQSVLTVAFEVGVPRQEAIVNLYNQIESHQDWLPAGLNIPKPIIKPMGIDDVPIMALTLSNKADSPNPLSPEDLTRLAHSLETEIKTISGTRDVYTLGEQNSVLTIELDPNKMNGHSITFSDIYQRLQSANSGGQLSPIVQNNQVIKLQAGNFLQTVEDIESLVIGRYQSNSHNSTNNSSQSASPSSTLGGLLYLSDIATVTQQADTPQQYVFIKTPKQPALTPAVTLAIAKQPGTNAVDITNAISQHLSHLENRLIPEAIQVTETRNYGITAENKSNKLIGKLLFATLAVVLLVLATMSWREAVIVGSAIFITLALTLFASWVWGFTLNRVSLFALIFSIGILVDDAIVVVENIHRHMQLEDNKNTSLLQLIPKAVDEVGSPTILATFTVIAALMPMAFVSGLMGPYMSPIPINASTGMLISLLVAFIVTPWLAYKLLNHSVEESNHNPKHSDEDDSTHSRSFLFFQKLMTPFIKGKFASRNRWGLMLSVTSLILIAVAFPAFKIVVLKMLPFDNKSELQIIVDMPEGTSLEQTLTVLDELSDYVMTIEEVKDVELYSGSAAPINFNGLVRQYYLRQAPHQGDLQINLVDKSQRDRKSHTIALALRKPLQDIGIRYNANVKIVEVPPGPPVMAPISAEIYGLNYEQQLSAAQSLANTFSQAEDVVDIDTWLDAPQQQWTLEIQRQRAMMLGLSEQTINQAITTASSGWDVGYLHSEQQKYALPMRLRLSSNYRDQLEQLLALKVRNEAGDLIALGEVVKLKQHQIEQTIYHKNQRPVMFVTADMAGPLDSPLYGLFSISALLSEQDEQSSKATWQQKFIAQPNTPATAQGIEIKWDGEWQITYETFRDMGIAYGIGMILIYLLVVAQFRSYSIPLVIMAPIPLTIIGVMPGHAIFGAQFTATSMIGMIALAGIIVRNSILLVDFINQQLEKGLALEHAVIQSAAVRAKPIILTGIAAMTGAFFILDDPIFNGLAISLIFGILVSTLMTLILIPLLFFVLKRGAK